MATVHSNATQTMTPGTTHVVATITTAGAFQFYADCSALVLGEMLEVIEEVRNAAGDWILADRATAARDAGSGMVYTIARLIGYGVRYSIRQVGGTGRSIPWHVVAG
jgi:hypothetical protein